MQLKIGKLFLNCGLMVLGVSSLVFADPQIKAKLSATEAVVGAQVILSYEISGVQGVGDFPTPNLPGFQVDPAGQTKSFQWINGVTSSLITFNFSLTPTQPGTFNIPAVTLSGDGKSVSSNPLSLTVHPDSSSGGAAPSRPAAVGNQAVDVPTEGIKPVFMTASVDKSKVVVGQQIILKVQFLRRPNISLLQQPRYSEPDLTGFLVEPMKQQEYSTNINGVPYQVTELRYALFPTSDGDFAIGSARIELALQQDVDPFDPNSFFQSFFSRGKGVTLNTRAIPIHARALPKTKPMDFSGAVGQFKISSRIDNTQLSVGKPFNLIVTIEGVGNIKTLKEPIWPIVSSLKRYESLSTSKISNEGKFVTGSKEFKVLMIPQVTGLITLPPIAYTYFDPEKNDFVTIMTQEISMQVAPGQIDSSAGISQAYQPSGQTQEGIKVIEKGIRFLKSGEIGRPTKPLFNRPFFYVLNFAPMLFALLAFLTTYYSRHRFENADYYRSKNALKHSLRILKQTHKNVNNLTSVLFFSHVSQSVSSFLANKLKISGTDLVFSVISKQLHELRISQSLIDALQDVWDTCDMARFATTDFSEQEKNELISKTISTLTELDKIL